MDPRTGEADLKYNRSIEDLEKEIAVVNRFANI